jgi:tetratricopeptide (TPR) repeat protein
VGLDLATRNYLPQADHRGWRPVPHDDPHALADGAPAPGYVLSRKVRLFPARADIRFQGVLHETVEASLAEAGLPVHAAPWPVHHFGMLADDADKPRRYLPLARRKVQDSPRSPRAWSELVDCAVACHREAEALAAVECGLALDPGHPDLNLSGGEILRRLGRTAEADRLLARVTGSALATRQQRAAAAHLRAQLALADDRTADAGPHILQSLRLDPGDPNALNTLGVWHLLRGDHERAERVLRRAAARLPGSAEPRLNLGRLHQREGRWEKARLWLEGALQVDPGCTKARDALSLLPAPGRKAAAP